MSHTRYMQAQACLRSAEDALTDAEHALAEAGAIEQALQAAIQAEHVRTLWHATEARRHRLYTPAVSSQQSTVSSEI